MTASRFRSVLLSTASELPGAPARRSATFRPQRPRSARRSHARRGGRDQIDPHLQAHAAHPDRIANAVLLSRRNRAPAVQDHAAASTGMARAFEHSLQIGAGDLSPLMAHTPRDLTADVAARDPAKTVVISRRPPWSARPRSPPGWTHRPFDVDTTPLPGRDTARYRRPGW